MTKQAERVASWRRSVCVRYLQRVGGGLLEAQALASLHKVRGLKVHWGPALTIYLAEIDQVARQTIATRPLSGMADRPPLRQVS